MHIQSNPHTEVDSKWIGVTIVKCSNGSWIVHKLEMKALIEIWGEAEVQTLLMMHVVENKTIYKKVDTTMSWMLWDMIRPGSKAEQKSQKWKNLSSSTRYVFL